MKSLEGVELQWRHLKPWSDSKSWSDSDVTLRHGVTVTSL